MVCFRVGERDLVDVLDHNSLFRDDPGNCLRI